MGDHHGRTGAEPGLSRRARDRGQACSRRAAAARRRSFRHMPRAAWTRLQGKPGRRRRTRLSPCSSWKRPTWCRRRIDFITAATAMNKARSQLNLAQIVEEAEPRPLPGARAVSAEGFPAGAGRPHRRRRTTRARPRQRWRPPATACASSARPTPRSRHSRNGARSALRRRSTRPSAAPWCSARSDPASTSTTASSDPVFVIGDFVDGLAARLRARDRCAQRRGGRAFRCVSRFWPSRSGSTKLEITWLWRRRSIRVRGVFWCGPRSIIWIGSSSPEMFATVTILTGSGEIPRRRCWASRPLIYEGENACVWVVRDDKTIELR